LAPLSPELEAELRKLNPDVERVIGRTEIDLGQLLFSFDICRPRESGGPGASAGSVALDSRLRGNDDVGLDHVHSHDIDTFAVTLEGAVSPLDFAVALGGLAQARGYDLLRVKGLVAFADRPDRPAVVQAAQHAMFAPEWLDEWPDADHRSRLVFVVHDIPRAEILAHFAFASPTLLH
jgi:G3E family GTPase